MHDTLDHKEYEFSALGTEYYSNTNEHQQFPSNKNYEHGMKRGEPLTIVGGSPFKHVDLTRAMPTTLILDSSHSVEVLIALLSNVCGSAQYSFCHLRLAQFQLSLSK